MMKTNQATILKIAAMLVAAPRYVGLMLYLSGFVFAGWMLDGLHFAEGVAGLALAVLEGFALAFILSRRQLGFSRADKILMLVVVVALLILLPLCATPYLLYLFDGTNLFAEQQSFVVSVLKFAWATATASMPVLIVVGVALVERDPVDVELLRAERQALLEQTLSKIRAETKQELSKIEAETEQTLLQHKLTAQQTKADHKQSMQQVEQEIEQAISKDFVCECGAAFDSPRALAGHKGHCKIKQNGKVAALNGVAK